MPSAIDPKEEIAAIRQLLAPAEWETTIACLKRRLKSAKDIEVITTQLIKQLVALEERGEGGKAEEGRSLLEKTGLFQKGGMGDGIAYLNHPFFYLLPKRVQQKAIDFKRRGGVERLKEG